MRISSNSRYVAASPNSPAFIWRSLIALFRRLYRLAICVLSRIATSGNNPGFEGKAKRSNVMSAREPDSVLELMLYAMLDRLPERPQPKRLPDNETVKG